jgi:hypothetical protein
MQIACSLRLLGVAFAPLALPQTQRPPFFPLDWTSLGMTKAQFKCTDGGARLNGRCR